MAFSKSQESPAFLLEHFYGLLLQLLELPVSFASPLKLVRVASLLDSSCRQLW